MSWSDTFRSLLLLRPKNQRFLYLLPLSIGVEFILVLALTNKLSGAFGILCLLSKPSTPAPTSTDDATIPPLQHLAGGTGTSAWHVTMSVYSLLSSLLLLRLLPSIRKQRVADAVVFAHWYLLDFLLNAAWTACWGAVWFLDAIANVPNPVLRNTSLPTRVVGVEDDGDTRTDMTTGAWNATFVPVTTSTTAQDMEQAPMGGAPGITPQMDSEMVASITIISAIWAVRLYFLIVAISYARGLVRSSRELEGQGGMLGEADDDADDAPQDRERSAIAAAGRSLERRCKGRIARMMVSWGRGFWEGPHGEDEEVGAGWGANGSVRFKGKGRWHGRRLEGWAKFEEEEDHENAVGLMSGVSVSGVEANGSGSGTGRRESRSPSV